MYSTLFKEIRRDLEGFFTTGGQVSTLHSSSGVELNEKFLIFLIFQVIVQDINTSFVDQVNIPDEYFNINDRNDKCCSQMKNVFVYWSNSVFYFKVIAIMKHILENKNAVAVEYFKMEVIEPIIISIVRYAIFLIV